MTRHLFRIDSRTPRVRKSRATKPGRVSAKKSEITLDSIKARAVTVSDVLDAVAE